MAELLYRVGKGAAGRAWLVVSAWAVVLAVAVAGFVVGYRGLSTSFDVPHMASTAVTDALAAELPQYAGASGTVVFRTTHGAPLSDGQKAAISALVGSARHLPDVAGAVDPFAAEAQRAAQQKQVTDGRAQIADATATLDAQQGRLDAGRTQLAAGLAQLDAGRQQLQQARQQAVAAGAPAAQVAALDAQLAQLATQRATLAAQQAQLPTQQAQLDAGRAQLTAQATKLERGATLLTLAAPIRLVSQDGAAAVAQVSFTSTRLDLPASAKDAVVAHFTAAPIDGVQVAFSTEIAQGVPQVFGVPEAVGLLVAIIVLVVMLGTALAAALPVVTAVAGVGIGVLATMALSGVVSMMAVTPVLGVMLGLAVGIDYSLFIVNRHRHQLAAGAEVVESIGLANGTAGNAVVFAGSTVVVALLALNVTGIPFLGLMGTVGAGCVALAVLIAISLTPALLGLVGQRVLGRRDRERLAHHVTTTPAPMRTWRAVVTTVAGVAVLAVLAVPALSLRLGLPDGSSEPVGSYAHEADAIVAQEMGAGANAALLVTADLPAGLDDDGVLAAQADVARQIAAVNHVTAVAPIAASTDRRLAAFEVVPAEGPNAASTAQVVRDLRALPPVDGSIALGVAGQAAINIDISDALAHVLPLYLLVVVGISLVITIVVFRSLIVPLIATGGFVLSYVAMLGAVVAVFQWGWLAGVFGIPTAAPVLSFLPLIFVGILFGLAMDYQLFLATGMREAFVHGSPARVAVREGFRAGRTVVVAAALIMVAVFGGFIFNESTIVRPLGFGLAVGVLLDAFVVRLLLMPALMHLVGGAAWWLPRWLDRILPRVDVEGAALERRHLRVS
jgi:RND superfamily putative drug exporter